MPRIDFSRSWRRFGEAKSWQEHFSAETLASWFDSRTRNFEKRNLFTSEEIRILQWLPMRAPERYAIIDLRKKLVDRLMGEYWTPRKNMITKSYNAIFDARKLTRADIQKATGAEKESKARARAALIRQYDKEIDDKMFDMQKAIVEAIYEARRADKDFGTERLDQYIDEVYPYMRNEEDLEVLASDFFDSKMVERSLDKYLREGEVAS